MAFDPSMVIDFQCSYRLSDGTICGETVVREVVTSDTVHRCASCKELACEERCRRIKNLAPITDASPMRGRPSAREPNTLRTSSTRSRVRWADCLDTPPRSFSEPPLSSANVERSGLTSLLKKFVFPNPLSSSIASASTKPHKHEQTVRAKPIRSPYPPGIAQECRKRPVLPTSSTTASMKILTDEPYTESPKHIDSMTLLDNSFKSNMSADYPKALVIRSKITTICVRPKQIFSTLQENKWRNSVVYRL